MGGYKPEYGVEEDIAVIIDPESSPDRRDAFAKRLDRFDEMHRLSSSPEKAGDRIWKKVVLGLQAIGREYLLENPKVLEVGCFEAQLLRYLLGQKIDAVGIDTDPRRVGIVPGKIFHMDAENTTFPDGEFDIAIIDGIFDRFLYNNDDDKIFPELFRIIKPGGLLYIKDLDWMAWGHHPKLEKYEDLFERIDARENLRSESITLLIRRNS